MQTEAEIPDAHAASITSPAALTKVPRRAAFAFVFITILLDMLAIGVVIPVLPRLIIDSLQGDTTKASSSCSSGKSILLSGSTTFVFRVLNRSKRAEYVRSIRKLATPTESC